MIDQTTADALNKALDLAKQGVVAAFETVKQYAPYVWSMARRQVLLEGVEMGIAWLLLAIFWAAVNIWSYRAHKDPQAYWDEEHAITFWVSSGIFLIITLVMMPDFVDLVGNPDYWTMHKILELVKSH